MTVRLYYEDAYLMEFDALVCSCTQGKSGSEVVLDRTAFYPEGGGQPADHGELEGVKVTDVRERDGEVVHICDAPLETGRAVHGTVERGRRFDHMQQHSGEHIVSGLICARFNCDNVGFHLGAETVVIDFNAPLNPADLAEIELEANRVIWENRPFLVSHPSPEELASLPYRSKKALSGDVRIVACPGADICACCGTHVRSAGEIGLIKLLTLKPFRGGVRIEMLSGTRAYRYVSMAAAQNHAVSVLTSAPEASTADAVERLLREIADLKYRSVGLENRIIEQYAKANTGGKGALLFPEAFPPEALRRCCEAVSVVCRGSCAVFSGADGEGYKYAVSGVDVKVLNTSLRGRGGGKGGFAQGSVSAARAEIEAWFSAVTA